MRLSVDQVTRVRTTVEAGGIQIESLKEDVLDHLCCAVEIKMERGKTFEVGLIEAILELAPSGLEGLQHETVFLLNSNKIIQMKKLMYLVGLLTSMSFVTGWVFKLLHIPGATWLSVCGFSGFAFVFLPLLAIDYYKQNIRRAMTEKIKFTMGICSAILVALSGVFKINHLEGASLLLVAGTGIFVFGFLPFLFFSLYKKSIS